MKKYLSLVAIIALFVMIAPQAFAAGDNISQGPGAGPYDVQIIQEVQAEISLYLQDSNVTLDSAIPGLTGGDSTASTVATVITNNATGYTLNIATTNNGTLVNGIYSIPAMATEGAWVDSSSLVNTAAFGYATDSVNFLIGATAGRDDVITSAATDADGVDTTITYKVSISAAPSPAIPAGMYYATSTFTASMN